MSSLQAIIAFIQANAVKYGPTVAAIASGVGLILAKDYPAGVQTILQALLVATGGAAAVQVVHGVHAVPERVVDYAIKRTP